MSTNKLERFNKQNINRGISYLKRNGVKKTFYKAWERIQRDEDEADYLVTTMAERPTAMELAAQRSKKFLHRYKFSILVPTYETKSEYLKGMLASVLNQTYDNWEICIADGSESDKVKNEVDKLISNLGSNDYSKIRYQKLHSNKGISGNTNAALVMASGDYICLLDHDDLLSPNALYEIMCVLDKGLVRDGNVYLNKYKMFYSDEDKVNSLVTRYFDYHKKPDFDIDLLRSNNYVCHFFVVRTSIAVKTGGFCSEYNGAQDHDFILKCSELVDYDEIVHIPKVLYHWRSHVMSTAENPESKLYAYEAGKKAVEDHLKRMNISAEVMHTPHLGFFRVKYLIDSPKVITLTREEWDSISADDFKALNCDYIMIMSKGYKPLTKDYINELAGMLKRSEVGAVGGKIYDPRGKIDSAGYSYDEKGNLCANYRGMNGNFSGYLHRASLQHKVDGLCKDCFMIKKSAVVFKDKPTLADDYLILYNPFAEFKRKGL